MPRIRCLYSDCIYIDDGFCTATSVEIDPDIGCATYAQIGDDLLDSVWSEDETLDDWDTEDLDLIDDDEDDGKWFNKS